MAKAKRTMEQRVASKLDPSLSFPQDRAQYKLATFAGRGRGFDNVGKAKPISFKKKN
jgi:hypothetical protein